MFRSTHLIESLERRDTAVKKMMLTLFSASLPILAWASFPDVTQAEVEWKVMRSFELKAPPLDVTPSADGQRIFVLTPGEIHIYSIPEVRLPTGFPWIRSLTESSPCRWEMHSRYQAAEKKLFKS